MHQMEKYDFPVVVSQNSPKGQTGEQIDVLTHGLGDTESAGLMENVAGDCNKYRKQVFLSDILTFTGTMSIDRAIDQWHRRLECVVH